MNKRLFPLLALLAWGALLPAQNALERIERSGVFNLGVLDRPAAPFVLAADHNWQGYEILRARQLAALLNAELHIRPYSSPEEAKQALNRAEIDLFFHKRFKTLGDGMTNFLTAPVARLQMVLVVNRRAFSALKLRPEIAARFLEGAFETAVPDEEASRNSFRREFPDNPSRLGPSAEQIWEDLKKGEIIGAYMDEARASRYFAETPSAGIALKYIPLGRSQEIIGLVSWKEDFFLEWLNIAIDGWTVPNNLSELETLLEGETHD